MESYLRGIDIRPYRSGCGPTFRLELFNQHHAQQGKHILSFNLVQVDPNGTETWIFEGVEFGFPGIHPLDSDRTLQAALTFATLRPGPGGNDPECFDSYTERQMEFAESHAEAVALAASEALGLAAG